MDIVGYLWVSEGIYLGGIIFCQVNLVIIEDIFLWGFLLCIDLIRN